jgi:hypothetical protein
MSSARVDIGRCLDENPVWKSHILRALDEIQQEFPTAQIEISIYNPGTGALTLYFATTREDGFLFVPTYSLIVNNPDPVRMYYGGLQTTGKPISFRQLLSKYYDNDLFGLLLTMSWGGRESRDVDVLEDLGLAYRSFRCDIEGTQRQFLAFRDERWRHSDPINIFDLFNEYIEKNENFVHQIVNKIETRRSTAGIMDGSSVERFLDEKAEVERGRKARNFFIGAPENCNLCGCPLSEEKYMIDGMVPGVGGWACMCADCFGFRGKGLGWGFGQLYLREGDEWLLVAGFLPESADIGVEGDGNTKNH